MDVFSVMIISMDMPRPMKKSQLAGTDLIRAIPFLIYPALWLLS